MRLPVSYVISLISLLGQLIVYPCKINLAAWLTRSFDSDENNSSETWDKFAAIPNVSVHFGSCDKTWLSQEDFTDGSDWDGTEEPARPPTRWDSLFLLLSVRRFTWKLISYIFFFVSLSYIYFYFQNHITC